MSVSFCCARGSSHWTFMKPQMSADACTCVPSEVKWHGGALGRAWSSLSMSDVNAFIVASRFGGWTRSNTSPRRLPFLPFTSYLPACKPKCPPHFLMSDLLQRPRLQWEDCRALASASPVELLAHSGPIFAHDDRTCEGMMRMQADDACKLTMHAS